MASTDVFSSTQGSREVGEDTSNLALPVAQDPKAPASTDALEDEKFKWMLEEVTGSEKHVMAWREKAQQAFRFMANKQLDPKDEQILRAAGRPTNAFNTSQKYIRYVSGLEWQSPEVLILRPDDDFDAKAMFDAEQATLAFEWAIRTCQGNMERSVSFEDMLVTGMGWEDHWVDSTSALREKYQQARFSPLEAFWPENERPNLRGTRWRARECFMDKDDVKRRWPDYETRIDSVSLSVFNDRPDPGEVKYIIPYVTTEDVSKKGPDKRKANKLKVMEFQWWDEEDGYVFTEPQGLPWGGGGRQWMAEKDFKKYQKNLYVLMGKNIEGAEEKVQKVYRRQFILERRAKLGDPGRIPAKRFTLNCMTGHWDEDSREWYGFFRVLIDPQRYANKFFNQLLEIIGSSAKGGLLVEDGAIEPKHRREFEAEYAKPGSVNTVSANALKEGRIQPKKFGELPAASTEILKFCVSSMSETTGLNPANTGGGSGDIGGPTENARRKSGLQLLAKEFGMLSAFRIEEAHICLALLGVMADGRQVFSGSNPYEGAIVKLDPKIFEREYDAFLDDTEHDPTVRGWYAGFIEKALPTLLRTNMFVPSLLDYLPIPVRSREEIKQSMMQKQQQMQEMAKMGIPQGGRGQPRDPRETQAKIMKLTADAAAQFAKAQSLTQGHKAKDYRSLVQALAEAERVDMEKRQQAHDIGMDRRQQAHDMSMDHKGHEHDSLSHIIDAAGGLVDMFRPQGGPGASQGG